MPWKQRRWELELSERSERPGIGVCEVSTTRLENGVVFVTASGELDLYTSPKLERALSAAIEDDAREVLVDLGECEFVDSTVLGALLDAHQRLSATDTRLAVVVPDRQIRRAFELTGLDQLFPIHDSRSAALADV